MMGSGSRLSRFLSTPSARRATVPCDSVCQTIEDFYPRPPRGGRLLSVFQPVAGIEISIHALREEGDPTTRVRVAGVHRISIHALREEGDLARDKDGNPVGIFLSTPSARRATHSTHTLVFVHKISIHALREEGDSKNRDKISIFKQIIQHSARI